MAQEELLKRSAQGVVENNSMKEAMKKAEAASSALFTYVFGGYSYIII